MNTLIFITLAALSTASASIIGLGATTLIGPAASGVALQGPSAEAAVTGPDGSAIASSTRGGSVVAAPIAGGTVTAAVSPGIVAASPVVLAAPALAAPDVIVAGPSGTIIANGLGGGPLILG